MKIRLNCIWMIVITGAITFGFPSRSDAQSFSSIERGLGTTFTNRGKTILAFDRFVEGNGLSIEEIQAHLGSSYQDIEANLERLSSINGGELMALDMLNRAIASFTASNRGFTQSLRSLLSLTAKNSLSVDGQLLAFVCQMELGQVEPAITRLKTKIIPNINELSKYSSSDVIAAINSLNGSIDGATYHKLRKKVMEVSFGNDLITPGRSRLKFTILPINNKLTFTTGTDFTPILDVNQRVAFVAPEKTLPKVKLQKVAQQTPITLSKTEPKSIAITEPEKQSKSLQNFDNTQDNESAPVITSTEVDKKRDDIKKKIEKPNKKRDKKELALFAGQPARIKIMPRSQIAVSRDQKKLAQGHFLRGQDYYREAKKQQIKAKEELNNSFEKAGITPTTIRIRLGDESKSMAAFFNELAKQYDDNKYKQILGRFREFVTKIYRALDFFQKAIEADPQLVDAYVGCSLVYFALGLEDEALMYLDASAAMGFVNLKHMNIMSDTDLKEAVLEAAKLYYNKRELIYTIRALEYDWLPDQKGLPFTASMSPDSVALLVIHEYYNTLIEKIETEIEKSDSRSKNKLLEVKWRNQFLTTDFLLSIKQKDLAVLDWRQVKRQISIENRKNGLKMTTSMRESIKAIDSEIKLMKSIQQFRFILSPLLTGPEYNAKAKIRIYRAATESSDPSMRYANSDDLDIVLLKTRHEISIRTLYESPMISGEEIIALPSGHYSVTLEIEGLRIREDNLLPMVVKIGELGSIITIQPDLNLYIEENSRKVVPLLFNKNEYDIQNGRVYSMKIDEDTDEDADSDRTIDFEIGVCTGLMTIGQLTLEDGRPMLDLIIDRPDYIPPSRDQIRDPVKAITWFLVLAFFLL